MPHLKIPKTSNLQSASTLGSHVTTIYSKITELQNQIQQHCMYPHTGDHLHTDSVQLEALDYDPDIDDNNNPPNNPRCITVLVNDIIDDEQSIPELIDDSSLEPDTTTVHPDPL